MTEVREPRPDPARRPHLGMHPGELDEQMVRQVLEPGDGTNAGAHRGDRSWPAAAPAVRVLAGAA